MRTPLIERLERVEGRTAWMYRCTGGRVTVGVGHALESVEEACALPWRAFCHAAPEAVIRRDYEAVVAAPEGMVAGAYKSLTTCRLTDEAINRLRDADIERFTTEISGALPYFAGLPEPAREALLDIGINCGVAGLLKFRRMLAAVEAGNWTVAAIESHRRDVSPERNREIADLLRRAAA